MEEEFQCPICLDIAADAVETSCCHHIYCEICIADIDTSNCPQCRLPFKAMPSPFARRVIGNMKVECEFKCGSNLVRSELQRHKELCTKRIFNCPAEWCNFQGLKDAFCSHLLMTHTDVVAKNANKLFNSAPSCVEETVVDGPVDRIATCKNNKGRKARLGSSGKFYCGGPLEYYCECCNGSCGPTNGCNCSSCMRLDVQKRMLPRNWLVNRSGFSARMSEGRYYCGRRVLEHVRGTDGYCGPTNGPHCQSCLILQRQAGSRYASVWQR